jgi:hypothetical protein
VVGKPHRGLPLDRFLGRERALLARQLLEMNRVNAQIIVIGPRDRAAVVGNLRRSEHVRLVERRHNGAARRDPPGELDLVGGAAPPFEAKPSWANDGDTFDPRRLVHRALS